ncbi:hypothetical protein ABB37_04719 [Leptomonas pyrrhocoris]|uniref:Uncharacterized protein n=1 Tax=Leptomonas pyrrhocoris TaxID=157538 RepID=A0A0M9G1T7_LEPPY|nr:hypothetical protein ABB37_04719 [Leptomonas pyrrhocoris]KPA80503.1 hypothetical protein ABB37_04719 [Leptomonas pyrrhocoris]|eukprot:XP_015658942.1 hypothetical protein ABB37_04719 [Leptomonas pyrrhocoris]
MPTVKKPRNKGVTYKLVPRSYGDADAAEGPIWVSEAEFYRNHQDPITAEDEQDKAQRQFRMYAAAANAEFTEERRRRRRTEGEEEDDDDGGEEEGEWVDGDWEEEGEEWEEEAEAEAEAEAEVSSAAAKSTKTVASALPGASVPTPAAPSHLHPPQSAAAAAHDGGGDVEPHHGQDASADRAADGQRGRDADKAEAEEQLFDDAVECEVTDDFLRQLVFGNGDAAGGDEDGGEGDDDDDSMMDEEDEDWDGLDEEDGEVWRLLTEEEKAAIKASRRRGTARRRKMASSGEAVAAAARTHAADGTEYPVHDVTQRAVDRQFTEMMREFNADARLNDACIDDPRTHGALPMEKYMAALEEFVMDRAGVDVETAEPHKNKGLIQQLKYLTHHAGAFDSDGQGTYMTTLLPEKQQRFVADFQKGTEEIRQAARVRVAQRRQAAAAAALVASPSATAGASGEAGSAAAAVPARTSAELAEEVEEEEEMIVLEVKPKADRLDCETAVSAYSTYYNQPNVLQAPRKGHPMGRGARKAVGVVKGNVISAAEAANATSSDATKKAPSRSAQLHASSNDDDDGRRSSGSDEDEVAATNAQRSFDVVPTVRRKDETKEEKKLRRQAVKVAQRERRQAKSALKSTYKNVEAEEVKRSATSQAARRTVHFM